MSKNDMVLVPRDLLDRVTRGQPQAEVMALSRISAILELAQLLCAPGQQHQVEPVAFLCTKKHRNDWHHIVDVDYEYLDNWRANPAILVQPLYTHVDPAEVETIKADKQAFAQNAVDLRAEVERLKRKCQNADLALKAQTQNRDILRDKLAEAQALLQKVLGHLKAGKPGEAQVALYNGLSASAEPSAPACESCYDAGHVPEPMSCKGSLPCPSCAPVEIDERAEFKSWCASVGYTLKATPHGGAFMPGYGSELFLAWKARAALTRKP